ncbi:hypothetical protein AB0E08_08190 [Streptomyces sp. NPDC048281]|uniref:hypothetical protein n=1 Tax=Streptomyces sp. NPDC048281 TaxID=3154715 RepID=UPI00341B83DA
MTRFHDWDDDSVTVAIIPQPCANCGDLVDRVRLSLEVITSSGSDFVGINTVAKTPCCDGRRNSVYPAEYLAKLLDHLKTCPNHSRIT